MEAHRRAPIDQITVFQARGPRRAYQREKEAGTPLRFDFVEAPPVKIRSEGARS